MNTFHFFQHLVISSQTRAASLLSLAMGPAYLSPEAEEWSHAQNNDTLVV